MKLGTVKPVPFHELRSAYVSHEYQRTLTPKRIRNCMQSMRKHGFWKSHPIVYFQCGNQKMIIWGHHRREAAMALKAGAFVQEATEITMEESINMIMAENWATWKTMDSIKLQIKLGNPDYITLQKYLNYGLPVSVAITALGGYVSSGNSGDGIKSGDFKVKTTVGADILAGWIERMRQVATPAASNGCLLAINKCLRVPNFSISDLEKRVRLNPSALEARTNTGDYLKVIETIYNFGNRNPLPLAFLADQSVKNKKSDVSQDDLPEAAEAA